MDFVGFPSGAGEFLWELRFNNERPWFQAHKEEFLTLVDRPFKALGQEIQARMQEAYPKREWNLHVSRIYRDARRLYGRGPMKDHLWLTLRCTGEKDMEVPVFYFEFQPEGYSFGLGSYSAHAAYMERFRRVTLAEPKQLETLARRLNKEPKFRLIGKEYARKKVEHSPLLDPWLNRRWISIDCSRPHDDVSKCHDLADEMVESFQFLMPYYDYFEHIRNLSD